MRLVNINSILRMMGYNFLSGKSSSLVKSSFEPAELKCYDKILDQLWEPTGCFRYLHNLNEVRVPLIYNTYLSSNYTDYNSLVPSTKFRDIKLLEVGSGGGIFSEALANLRFDVTGIDPNLKMIAIAKDHAEKNRGLRNKRIRYIHTTVEDFAKKNENSEAYDGVILSEVLECVVQKDKFLEASLSTLKPGGSVFITTKNITFKFLVQMLVSASLDDFPIQTQNVTLFTPPWVLEKALAKYSCVVKEIRGFKFGQFYSTFSYSEDEPKRWYYIHAVKQSPKTVTYIDVKQSSISRKYLDSSNS